MNDQNYTSLTKPKTKTKTEKQKQRQRQKGSNSEAQVSIMNDPVSANMTMTKSKTTAKTATATAKKRKAVAATTSVELEQEQEQEQEQELPAGVSDAKVKASKDSSPIPTPITQMNDQKTTMDFMLDKLKKRQLDSTSNGGQGATKKAYTGTKRIDLWATIVAVHNTKVSERFTVIISPKDIKNLVNEEKVNGFYEPSSHSIRMLPRDQERLDDNYVSIIPGEIVQISRYHGGQPDLTPDFTFGNNVWLRSCSASLGKQGDGKVFFNVSRVEHTDAQFDFIIPKSMSDLTSESYYKAITFPVKEEEEMRIQDLRVTSGNKIYSRVSIIQEHGGAIEAMLWQEKLAEFGIRNPETLEQVLPEAFARSKITLLGNIAKDDYMDSKDGNDTQQLKLNVRKIILGTGTGTLKSYVEEYGEEVEKQVVIADLGKVVTSEMHDGHPLNSLTGSKVLNISEWTGSLEVLMARTPSTKIYKLFGVVYYATQD